jgi:hypothetical protein
VGEINQRFCGRVSSDHAAPELPSNLPNSVESQWVEVDHDMSFPAARLSAPTSGAGGSAAVAVVAIGTTTPKRERGRQVTRDRCDDGVSDTVDRICRSGRDFLKQFQLPTE